MATNAHAVQDILFGRWRSRILYAATKLGIFDVIPHAGTANAADVASQVRADAALLYRLLRALASIGLLKEEPERHFRLTDTGSLLRADAPDSLRGLVLLQEGPEHYAIWRDLAGMIADGRQNGFLREFGAPAFEYASSSTAYSATFSAAMSSASTAQAASVIAILADRGMDGFKTICDVGGGQGHLVCTVLEAFEDIQGVVFDLPAVVADAPNLYAVPMNLEARCDFRGGDMFVDVPTGDAYFLKLILHDWNDDQCIDILRVIRQRVPAAGRLFIVERIVPDAGVSHFSKLYDIHMLCWGDGRERTVDEYRDLLQRSGWDLVQTLNSTRSDLAIIEASPG